MTYLRWALRALALLAACVVLLVIGLIGVGPKLVGGNTYTVLTGSMEPTISPGDEVIQRPTTFDEVKVGDIIIFQPRSGDPTLVTHRVVEKRMGGVPRIVTKGDANGAADEPIKPGQVKGIYLYHVPKIGHVLLPVRDAINGHRAIVYGVLAAALAYWVLGGDDEDEEAKTETETSDGPDPESEQPQREASA